MAKNAFPKSGGIVNGNVDATGYVKSGEGKDVVSSQDIWAKRYIYESGLRVYSPNNKPSAGDVGAYTKDEAGSLIVPVGVPMPYPHRYTPVGYLTCNGQTFNKSLYPKLAEAYPAGRVPDLRGEFIRGWDDGRGVDPGRVCGTWQGDAIRNITGDVSFGGNYGFDAVTEATGVFLGKNTMSWRSNTRRFDSETANTNLVFNASRAVPTANENRPRNIAFNYIVRAA
ncbi:phage tail protein [Photorhabdus heterorhabditis]|uniref:phage tail protein n=1 Tax=Photorhabdus heterorhabditis TaxID=880156 RepID=UPI001FD54AF2|nr:phage tail protein [Photorhabdus heterorhabditis]